MPTEVYITYTVSVVRRISVREARANLADLIGSVQHTGEPVVIERRGKPVVAMVPAGDVGGDRSWDPAVDAEIDELLADTPGLRRAIEAGREVRSRAPSGRSWEELRAAALDERVGAKARKKGLAPGRTVG